MTLRATLLAGSIALNAAILAALAMRPALAPATVRDFMRARFQAKEERTAARAPRPPGAVSSREKIGARFDAGGNVAELVARLRAAGFPPGVIREMVVAEVNARYQPRIRVLRDPDPNTPFWKQTSYLPGYARRMEEATLVERERSRVLRELFQDPFFATDDVTAGQRRQFGNLPRQKIDTVQRIEDDYAEMTSAIRAAMGGVTLPEDREKLALLNREKRADLAGVLTAAELADYEVRSSPITSMLRSYMTGFEASETEFRAIVRMQQELNEKFPTATGGTINFQSRQEAHQQLNAALKAEVGEARYADYIRETSSDFQQLRGIVAREGLAPDAALRAFNLRNTVAQESNRIFDDPALDSDQKRAALQALAQTTRAQLVTALGPKAGPAYVKVVDNQWLSMVERGNAVTFDGGPNMIISSGTATVSLGMGANYRNVPRNTPPSR